jgi:alkylhydroperoxidase family enzyme
MQARMKNPAMVLPGGMEVAQGLSKAVFQGGGVDKETLELVHLRASQLNGCSACVGYGVKLELVTEKLWLVSAWREAPCFNDAERAALELAEAMTRLADRRGDSVSDELWTELTKHYDEQQLAALIFWIATANFYNRINTTIKESAPPGADPAA